MVKELMSRIRCDEAASRKTAAAKIFDTARDLFYRRGVRAVGVDEIVCEAGVTKPSLYRAYASKDDLVAACVKESAAEGRAAMKAAVDGAGPDPRDQLNALFRLYADKIACPDFRGCPIGNIAVELPEPGHPGRSVATDCKAEMRATVGGITRRLGIGDPDALADGLMLVIEGAMASHHVFGSQGPARSLLATCEALTDLHVMRG